MSDSLVIEGLKIVLTAALAAGATVALERFRSARARRSELRAAYLQWFSAHSSLAVSARALVECIRDTRHVQTLKALERLVDDLHAHLSGVHSGVTSVTLAAHAVQMLEQDPRLRKAVDIAGDYARNVARQIDLIGYHYCESHIGARLEFAADSREPQTAVFAELAMERLGERDANCKVIHEPQLVDVKSQLELLAEALQDVRTLVAVAS